MKDLITFLLMFSLFVLLVTIPYIAILAILIVGISALMEDRKNQEHWIDLPFKSKYKPRPKIDYYQYIVSSEWRTVRDC